MPASWFGKLSLALAATVALAAGARPAVAATRAVHLAGLCSEGWLDGSRGGGFFGAWPDVETIDARVDQRGDMTTATNDFRAVLDANCTGDDMCIVYTYSNGGAVLSRTLSLYGEGQWNVAYVVSAASNEGGSEIGGTGTLGELFGGCEMAGHIGPTDHRQGWNHHDTDGVDLYLVGGNGWLAPYVQSALLPGSDDGAVAFHSAGGMVQARAATTLCTGEQWTNHHVAWSCGYQGKNHFDMKMVGVCNQGGCD